MRKIVLDTETTGLDKESDRIVEVGCIELLNDIPTDRIFQSYVNPQRPMSQEAYEVHGLGDKFLSTKPLFGDIALPLLEFIEDSPLIMHNASFDMGFLDAAFVRLGKKPLSGWCEVIDTLEIARAYYPGQHNSLDALCQRFHIEAVQRKDGHGALLDARLLAAVYLNLMGGRERSFSFQEDSKQQSSASPQETSDGAAHGAQQRPSPLPSRLSAQDQARHKEFVDGMDGDPLWGKFY